MSSGLHWLKLLVAWTVLLSAARSDVLAHEVTDAERDGVVHSEGAEEAEDRAVGGSFRPPFDAAFSVPSSHGEYLSNCIQYTCVFKRNVRMALDKSKKEQLKKDRCGLSLIRRLSETKEIFCCAVF